MENSRAKKKDQGLGIFDKVTSFFGKNKSPAATI